MDTSFPLGSPLYPPVGAHSERRDRGGLRRIRDMRFAEIAYRGWQEAARWLERVAPAELAGQPDALLRRHAPALSEADAAERVIRDRSADRFFAGAGQAGTSALIVSRLPDHRDQVVRDADMLAGSPSGPAPDDQQGVLRLAQAYALTGEERYAGACARAITAWLDAHPPGAGSRRWHSADTAFHLVAWCWTLVLTRNSGAFTGQTLTRVLAAIWLHATHVRRHVSCRCSPTTHLTGEALGLFYAATLFPEFLDAGSWRDTALQILESESDTQISGDGVHFEQSTYYQRYSSEIYLHFLLLAGRNGIQVPQVIGERVQRMLDFLLAVRQPDGAVPQIGDDDGGTPVPLTSRETAGDCRSLFGVAASMFGRPSYAWAAGGLTPEVAWLTGSEGVDAFTAVRPSPPASAPSQVFPTGGYAVMRTGWEADAHHVIVDIGPLGCPVSASHGHADLLSIQCSIFGEPCLVDAGTYSLTCEPEWRSYFRGTAAHSTVMIDGRSQAEPAGPFGWHRAPRVRLREWHSTPEFDFLDAEHGGYLDLADPVVHRRRVIFVKPGYWILVDDLSGSARHQVDLRFQFGALDVRLGAHPWARAETAGGRVLWVCPFPSGPVQPALSTGSIAPISGWISRGYGHREPAPLLNYSFAVALPWRIVTVLLPDRQGPQHPPAVRAIYDDGGLPTGVAFERPRRSVRFDDHAVLVERE